MLSASGSSPVSRSVGFDNSEHAEGQETTRKNPSAAVEPHHRKKETKRAWSRRKASNMSLAVGKVKPTRKS